MNEVNVKNESFFNLPVFFLVGCWIIYTAGYLLLKNAGSVWSGVLSSVSVVLLDAVGIYYILWLWKSSKGRARRIFGFFVISSICALLADAIYFLLYNILHLPHDGISSFLRATYNIPTVIYLFFHLLVFASILPTIKYQKKSANFIMYAPVIIVVAILCTMFVLSTKTSGSIFFSYDQIEMVFQLAGFILALLCFIVAKNKGVLCIAAAYLIDTVAELIMNAGLFSQAYGTQSFVETLWFLDSILCLYGLYYFKRSGTYQEEPINWTYAQNSLRSQTACWFLVLGVLTMVLGIGISYIFAPSIFF